MLICGHHEHCCVLITSLVHVGSADLLLPFRCRCKSLNKTVVLHSEILGGGRGFSPLIRQLGVDRRTRQHFTERRYLLLRPILLTVYPRPRSDGPYLHAEGLSPLGDAHCLLKEGTLQEFSDSRSRWRCCAAPPCSPVLQRHPETAVGKQWKQTVTPTSIDLAPLAPPILTNNTPLIPPTLNLYEPPTAAPLFPPGLTKMINDQPLTPSVTTFPEPHVLCPRLYKPISPCG